MYTKELIYIFIKDWVYSEEYINDQFEKELNNIILEKWCIRNEAISEYDKNVEILYAKIYKLKNKEILNFLKECEKVSKNEFNCGIWLELVKRVLIEDNFKSRIKWNRELFQYLNKILEIEIQKEKDSYNLLWLYRKKKQLYCLLIWEKEYVIEIKSNYNIIKIIEYIKMKRIYNKIWEKLISEKFIKQKNNINKILKNLDNNEIIYLYFSLQSNWLLSVDKFLNYLKENNFIVSWLMLDIFIRIKEFVLKNKDVDKVVDEINKLFPLIFRNVLKDKNILIKRLEEYIEYEETREKVKKVIKDKIEWLKNNELPWIENKS